MNTPFDVVPYNDGGRFTFLFDDINANAGSATIEPDGGGYMLKFYFETSGTEVRSICEPRLFHPDFGFESEEGKTAEDILAFLANGWKQLSCALGGEYTAELGFITAEVRVFLEAVDVPGGDNDIRFRPVSPVNPTRDIFVDFDVLTQSGPCEGNLMAIQDDCREKDELEVELEAELQAQLGDAFKTALTPSEQSSNMFGVMMGDFKSAWMTYPSDLLGVFIGDVDGVNEGDIYFIH